MAFLALQWWSSIICSVWCVRDHWTGNILATGEDTFLNMTAWGPLLGPSYRFCRRREARCAAKVGKLKSGGKDIVSSLMGLNAPDVLIVGGVFGMLGYVLNCWIITCLRWFSFTNGPSLAIIISALIVRLLFGNTGLFGKKYEKVIIAGVHQMLQPGFHGKANPEQLILIAIDGVCQSPSSFGSCLSYSPLVSPRSCRFGIFRTGSKSLFFTISVSWPAWPRWPVVGILVGFDLCLSSGFLGWNSLRRGSCAMVIPTLILQLLQSG